MTEVTAMTPDERVFREHLNHADFVRGVGSGRWRLLRIDWPHVWIAIRAAPRDGAPDEFVLRFELTDYPTQAPTATPWDEARGTMLEASHRPKGDRVAMAFRANWEGGAALYIPCDRVAIRGHSNWSTQYPAWTWNASRDITLYLRLVHEMLNDPDYAGV